MGEPELLSNMHIGNLFYLYSHVFFTFGSAQQFCSVGDDSCLILWDARAGLVPVSKVMSLHLVAFSRLLALYEMLSEHVFMAFDTCMHNFLCSQMLH